MAVINGSEKFDILNGTSSSDTIKGGGGDDTINGLNGNDYILGGAGADKIDGGNGIDTASYEDSNAGVTVHLVLHVGLGGTAQGDTLINIENIAGSNFDDNLIGDNGTNVIDGGTGNDFISGGAGADALKGGAGIDTLSYRSSSAGVWVSLETGVAFYGDAQGDSFTNFENLIGSAYDDQLIGDAGVNIITGGAGNDLMAGDGYFPTTTSTDTFVFDAAGFGQDIVGDFVAGQDRIQLDDAIFADFTAVQSHMQQVGSHVVITFDASNTITLWNVQTTSLHASDFIFVA